MFEQQFHLRTQVNLSNKEINASIPQSLISKNIVNYPLRPWWLPAGDLSLLTLILTLDLSSTLQHTVVRKSVESVSCVSTHWPNSFQKCFRSLYAFENGVTLRVSDHRRQQSTHTLRAFCLQISRAVIPTNMAIRNKPALTPSITPLIGSGGQKQKLEYGEHLLYLESSQTVFGLTGLGEHRQ